MINKLCDLDNKATCLNKLCSKFEVVITKIEAPVRSCLGAIATQTPPNTFSSHNFNFITFIMKYPQNMEP